MNENAKRGAVEMTNDMLSAFKRLTARIPCIEFATCAEIDEILRLDMLVPRILRELGVVFDDSLCGEIVNGIKGKVGVRDGEVALAVERYLLANEGSTSFLRFAYPQGEPSVRYWDRPSRLPMFIAAYNEVMKSVAFGALESEAIETVKRHMSLEDAQSFLTWYDIKRKKLSGEHMSNIRKYSADEGYGAEYVYEFYRKNHDMAHTENGERGFVDQMALDASKLSSFKGMRDKMISRTFAIDKILEKYVQLLKPEQVEIIEDSLNALRKNIRKLKQASSINDSLVKTANIASKVGWMEGAAIISALGASDEEFAKVATKIIGEKDLTNVMRSLGGIVALLRQRLVVRELAAHDINLYNLGYGHISGVGDAASKLMEVFNSAANKVEDALSQLRENIGALEGQQSHSLHSFVDPESLPIVDALRNKDSSET